MAENSPDLTDSGWLTMRQACRLLGVSEPTLRKWADAGRIAVFRTPGGHRRFTVEAIERFRRALEEDWSAEEASV